MTCHDQDRFSLLLMFASFVCVSACDLDEKNIAEGGGMEAGDGDGDAPEPPGVCGVETNSVIENLDAAPITFDRSVNEIIAGAAGEYAGEFNWLANDGFETAHAGTSSPLSMTLSYEGGEVRLREVAQHGNLPGGQLGGSPCSNSLEIDARLLFSTEDGLFDEDLDVTLRVEAIGGSGVQLNYDIDFATHQGSLVYEDFSFGDSEVTNIVLGLGYAGATSDGYLGMEVFDAEFDVVGFGPVANIESTLVGANSDCGACGPDEFCLITEVENDFFLTYTYACTAVPEGCEAQDCECLAVETCPDVQNMCELAEVATLNCMAF